MIPVVVLTHPQYSCAWATTYDIPFHSIPFHDARYQSSYSHQYSCMGDHGAQGGVGAGSGGAPMTAAQVRRVTVVSSPAVCRTVGAGSRERRRADDGRRDG